MHAIELLACLLVFADAGDANKKDVQAMQGNWACFSYTRDGMTFDDDSAGALFRTVKDNHYEIHRFRKKAGAGTFALDTSKTPRWIDVAPEGPAKLKPILGIYKLEGDTMTTCHGPAGGPRPTEFTAREGSGQTLAVWKREKK